MKSTELRIGNWILGTPTYNKDLLMKFQVYAETFCDIESGYGLFEPIQLTEDILLKCGFKYNFLSYDKDLFSVMYNLETDTWSFYITQDYDIEIRYLHQLQNLYYILTNQELNINF